MVAGSIPQEEEEAVVIVAGSSSTPSLEDDHEGTEATPSLSEAVLPLEPPPEPSSPEDPMPQEPTEAAVPTPELAVPAEAAEPVPKVVAPVAIPLPAPCPQLSKLIQVPPLSSSPLPRLEDTSGLSEATRPEERPSVLPASRKLLEGKSCLFPLLCVPFQSPKGCGAGQCWDQGGHGMVHRNPCSPILGGVQLSTPGSRSP